MEGNISVFRIREQFEVSPVKWHNKKYSNWQLELQARYNLVEKHFQNDSTEEELVWFFLKYLFLITVVSSLTSQTNA